MAEQKGSSKKKLKFDDEEKDVSAIISKQLDKKLKEMSKKREEKEKTDEDAKAYIMSLFSDEEKPPTKSMTASSTSTISSNVAKKVDLKSILKRAKNN